MTQPEAIALHAFSIAVLDGQQVFQVFPDDQVVVAMDQAAISLMADLGLLVGSVRDWLVFARRDE
jgi:hypothetical protein